MLGDPQASQSDRAADKYPEIDKADLLGHPYPLEFVQNEAGLKVVMSETEPCEHAFAVKITKRHSSVTDSN